MRLSCLVRRFVFLSSVLAAPACTAAPAAVEGVPLTNAFKKGDVLLAIFRARCGKSMAE